MAFSTFRGFFGASAANTGPVDSDTFQAMIPVATADGSGNPYKFNIAPIPGSSTTAYAVGSSSGNVLTAFIATSNGSYMSLGSSLALSTNARGDIPAIDSVDSTHFIPCYNNSSSTTQILAQYITNSSGTLSATVGATVVVTGGALVRPLVAVLDSSNALVMGYSSTPSNNRMSLINPTTLSVTQSNTNASSIAATTTNLQIFALSPTLAVVSWVA